MLQPEVVSIGADSVAHEITTLHEEMVGMAKRTIETAIYIGELLLLQKQKLGHGSFIPWVERELPFGRVQANKYIKLFHKQDMVNDKTSYHLGLDSALSQIRQAEKQEKQEEVLHSNEDGQTLISDDLEKLIDSGMKFKTVYADPPWQYGNQGTRAATNNHYKTMTVSELAALPISQVTEENAHLHLWTTNGFLFESKEIMESWGFTYKSCFVWVKPIMGIGNYWRVSHEFLLFGLKGKLPFQDRSQFSWGEFKRNKHSSKPEKIRKIIERVSPGPYLELFGRMAKDGWTVFGNEVQENLMTINCKRV